MLAWSPIVTRALSKFRFTSGCTLFVEPFSSPSRQRGEETCDPDGVPEARVTVLLRCRSGGPGGASSDVLSFGSRPAIALKTVNASAAVRQMGPTLSNVQLSAIAPNRLTRP